MSIGVEYAQCKRLLTHQVEIGVNGVEIMRQIGGR